MAVGIICACLPATRSLLSYLFPNIKMSLISKSNEGHASYPLGSRPTKHSQIRRIGSEASLFELSNQNERKSGTTHESAEGSMYTSGSKEENFQNSLRPKGEGNVSSKVVSGKYHKGSFDGKGPKDTIIVTTDVSQTRRGS